MNLTEGEVILREGTAETITGLNSLEKEMIALTGLSLERGMPLAMMEKELPVSPSMYGQAPIGGRELAQSAAQAIGHLLGEGIIEQVALPQPSINQWYRLTEKGGLIKAALPKEKTE